MLNVNYLLFDGLRKKDFYIVPTQKNMPLPMLLEMRRFVTEDMEQLITPKTLAKRPKAQQKRVFKAMQKANL